MPKASAEDDKAAGMMPVPLKLAVWGELVALSLTVNTPVRDPAAVGVNVTEMLQLACAPSVVGDNGQLEVCAKSPVVEIAAILSGIVWLFCSVRS